MSTEKFEASLEELLLDLDNPRMTPVTTQAEALEGLVRLDPAKFRNMMKSIRDHGLDPGDSFYVISSEDDEDYIVVDGNRRLAALKVLQNPALLKGTRLPESMQRPLLKAGAGFVLPADFSVDSTLFDSRETARAWIERRHGRGMDGEARIPWNSADIQRFQGDRSILDVIEFLERNSGFSEGDWARIKGSLVRSTSTLRRVLDSRPGKELVGYEKGTRETGPTFTGDTKEVLAFLSHIAAEIDSNNLNSRTVNTAGDVQDYLDSLPPELKPKPSKSTPRSFAQTDIEIPGGKAKSQPKSGDQDKKKKSKPMPKERLTLAPPKHHFAAPEREKGRQLVREAAALKLRQTPLAAGFTFRAIIEFSVDTYMKAHALPAGKDGKPLELGGRLDKVIDHLVANGVAKRGDLQPIKTTLTSGPMSIGALNGFIHNDYQMPTPDALLTAWENASPLFVCVFGAAK